MIVGFIVAVVLILLIAAAAVAARRNMPSNRTDYFTAKYGGSIDRMLRESPVDKDSLRLIRDTDKRGEIRATRALIKQDPVPLEIAVEFIRRL